MSAPRPFEVTVNGVLRQGRAEPRLTLADWLREDLRLTGTHLGCEHGVCGACTVLVDGVTARSCLLFAVQADGAEIQTVEGLATGPALSDLQQAFKEEWALQCGFCTPGFLLVAEELLRRRHGGPEPAEPLSAAEVRAAISGNICRCTGYEEIVRAVLRTDRRRAAASPADGGREG